jgi:hypothetical protein
VLSVDAAPKLLVTANAAGHAEGSRWLDVAPTDTALHADLVLPRTRALEGVVVDQFGEPAAGMWLIHDGQQSVERTDADGRFRIAGFPAGPRRLTVALAPGAERTHWTGEQSPETVDAERGPVRIVVQRRPGRVDVRVVIVDAASGEALEPSKVALWLWHDSAERYVEPKQLQSARGIVTATATPAGRWRLDVVTVTGHRGAWQFEIAEGQPPVEHRLALPAPGTITGRLRFVGVAAPASVSLHVRHATLDGTSFVQYRYPGQWRPEVASQSVTGNEHGGTGSLRMHPAQNAAFRLDAVDTGDDIVFEAEGEGVTGTATVRVGAGGAREVVIEMRANG